MEGCSIRAVLKDEIMNRLSKIQKSEPVQFLAQNFPRFCAFLSIGAIALVGLGLSGASFVGMNVMGGALSTAYFFLLLLGLAIFVFALLLMAGFFWAGSWTARRRFEVVSKEIKAPNSQAVVGS